jgi:hypothetical protein
LVVRHERGMPCDSRWTREPADRHNVWVSRWNSQRFSICRHTVAQHWEAEQSGCVGVGKPDSAGQQSWFGGVHFILEGRQVFVREDVVGIRHVDLGPGNAWDNGEQKVGLDGRRDERHRNGVLLCGSCLGECGQAGKRCGYWLVKRYPEWS